jgi:hypothetical protein
LLLEKGKEGMGALAIDVDFLGDVEFVTVGLDEVADVLRGARLLLSELVARTEDDLQAPRLISVGQIHQLLVIGLGEAALAGNVDDQDDLPIIMQTTRLYLA